VPVADLASGLWVAISILTCAGRARRDGKGSYVDFSMIDGRVALLTLAAARYFALGEVPPRLGTSGPHTIPVSLRRRRLAHITASDQHWRNLCRVLGLEAWGQPGLAANSDRVRRRDGDD
jgi:crotonobetainyl-CoA:carnitine CoA-transferase CaiB-like acyl-CoA transferase